MGSSMSGTCMKADVSRPQLLPPFQVLRMGMADAHLGFADQGELAGHAAACLALAFHPFGEFFGSGSSDSSLKLWDVRQTSSCIHTYLGHGGPVTQVRFSPDGKILASGSADGAVKVRCAQDDPPFSVLQPSSVRAASLK